MLANYRVFLREFVRSFHTTGAILPSGRRLCRALATFVREAGNGRRILEVGPGTGAVTARIIDALADDDRLDLVELNTAFVARLNDRLAREPRFQRVAGRVRVIHASVESLPGDGQYDLIVSGLPLNNFAADDVETILAAMARLAKPGAVLSFFEYVGVRPMRTLVSGRAERERLRDVGRAIARLLDGQELRRQCVLSNVPPAWVHHLRITKPNAQLQGERGA